MDEAPAGAISRVTRYVNSVAEQAAREAVEGHEQRMHIPAPRRGRVTAIPFASINLNDVQVARAMELLSLGSTLAEAAFAVDAPTLVLERCLAEYQPAWRQFLAEREAGV